MTRRGFTLIELLIVVAIVAIFTASSMMALTGPMFERVRAEDDEAFETGAGVLFATLAADAHRSNSMAAETTGSLSLDLSSPTPGTIVYTVTDQRVLTRSVDDQPPVKLISGIEDFSAEQTESGLWSVSLSASVRGYDGLPTSITRRMDVFPGSAWTGGV